MLTPKGSGGSLVDTPFNDPNLTVIQGDVTDSAAVDDLFARATGQSVEGDIIAYQIFPTLTTICDICYTCDSIYIIMICIL